MTMPAKQTKQDYKIYVIIAIAFHAILLLLFFMQLHFSNPAASEAKSENVINAVAISSHSVTTNRDHTQQKLAQLQQEKLEQMREQAEQEKLKLQQNQTQQETAAQQMQAKEQKLAQQLQLAEQAKLSALKSQADKQKAIMLKQKQQDIKLAKQQLLQAVKQDQTLQKDLQKQELAQDDTALKQQQLAKLRKQDADDLLQQQLSQEQNQLSSTRAQYVDSVVAKYKALITSAIGQHWLIPDTSNKNLSATLDITLAPGGVVLDVKLIKTSGDPALDRSAIAAVYKSSPLPVPADATLFDNFRELNLTVRPENILNA